MIWLLLIISSWNFIDCIDSCEKLDQYCYCDEKCPKYGDCCPGHQLYNEIGTLTNVSTCKPVSRSLSTQIIDKCPDPNHKLSDLCIKTRYSNDNYLRSIIPVITRTGEVYDNLFCAHCNNIKNFKFVKISIYCQDNKPKNILEAIELLKNQSLCSVTALFSDDVLRPCIDKFIRKCPKDFSDKNGNQTVIDFCERKNLNNSTLYTDGDNYYRNKFCCDCWNVTCYVFDFSNQPLSSGFSQMLNFNEWENNKLRNRPNVIDINTTTNLINQNKKSVYNNVFYYLCLVFTFLSIISLLLLISIYLYDKTFHTFGGYLTICLSSCLLLMQIMTLIPNHINPTSSSLCKCLAAFKHYISLCTFVWMAVYAFDLMQTFAFRSANRNHRKSLKSFLNYCGLGFGLVGVVVSAAVITEISASEDSAIKPEYGGRQCWFTSKIGGIIWYFVPVCLLLIWNFVACVIVFYKLSKTVEECRVVQQNDTTNTLWLCVRLTAVFGIGYLFQILAILSSIGVMISIGSLVNCLQGFLLAVCFLWTKRVITVVRTTLTMVTSTSSTTNPTTKISLVSTSSKKPNRENLLE